MPNSASHGVATSRSGYSETLVAIPASSSPNTRPVKEGSAKRLDRELNLDAYVRVDLRRRESRTADDWELPGGHWACVWRGLRPDVGDADGRAELQPRGRGRDLGLRVRAGDGLLACETVRGSFGARRIADGEGARRVVFYELRDEGRHAVDLVALDRDLLVGVERDDLLAFSRVVGELRLELERTQDDVAVLDA